MVTRVPRLLFWTPRVLCILLAAFLSIFALDVFNEGNGVVETILALIMHLLPTTFLVVLVLVISWRFEVVGAVVYITLGLFYAVIAWNKFPDAVLMISGPAIGIGILFAINAMVKERIRKASGAEILPPKSASG